MHPFLSDFFLPVANKLIPVDLWTTTQIFKEFKNHKHYITGTFYVCVFFGGGRGFEMVNLNLTELYFFLSLIDCQPPSQENNIIF